MIQIIDITLVFIYNVVIGFIDVYKTQCVIKGVVCIEAFIHNLLEPKLHRRQPPLIK